MVVENLGARPARARVAHGPEIVRAGDADDPRFRKSGDLLPEIESLVVIDIDGRRKPILRQAERFRDELPGQLDRHILEVITEREISEHLEEGVVTRGVTDVVEVVVLAACTHAFLRGHRPLVRTLLYAREHVLELDHARVREHERRVVPRNERRRRHRLVTVPREIVDEGRPDFVDAAHVQSNSAARAAGRPERRTAAWQDQAKVERCLATGWRHVEGRGRQGLERARFFASTSGTGHRM